MADSEAVANQLSSRDDNEEDNHSSKKKNIITKYFDKKITKNIIHNS